MPRTSTVSDLHDIPKRDRTTRYYPLPPWSLQSASRKGLDGAAGPAGRVVAERATRALTWEAGAGESWRGGHERSSGLLVALRLGGTCDRRLWRVGRACTWAGLRLLPRGVWSCCPPSFAEGTGSSAKLLLRQFLDAVKAKQFGKVSRLFCECRACMWRQVTYPKLSEHS